MSIFLLRYRDKASIIMMSLFYIFFPLVDCSGQISYLSFEIISILFFRHFISSKQYDDVFFKWYLLVVAWCIVVTLLSANFHRSFISLRYWIIPLMVYITFINIDIKKTFSIYIWLPTVILLLENIVLFLFWSKFSYLFTEFEILKRVLLLMGDWFAKIYTSTVILCMIIGVYYFIKPSKNRNALLVLNFISAFFSYDRAFWFSLLLVLLAYMVLEKFKLSLLSLFKGFIVLVVSLSLLLFIMHFIGMDLHYKERFATYSYWLSVIHVSPIYGVGVGRDSLQYYTEFYPVPKHIMNINPFTPFTSHNFFLDLLVTQGVVGLLIFILLLYKINISAIKNSLNHKYKYVTLYMTIAIFSKFLVDNQFDNRKIFVFWCFIIMGYLCSKQKSNTLTKCKF